MDQEILLSVTLDIAEEYLTRIRNPIHEGHFDVSIPYIKSHIEHSIKHSLTLTPWEDDEVFLVRRAVRYAANEWNSSAKVMNDQRYLLGRDYFVIYARRRLKQQLHLIQRPAASVSQEAHNALVDQTSRAQTEGPSPDSTIPDDGNKQPRTKCQLQPCKASWPAGRRDCGWDHLARAHDWYRPGDKNVMSIDPRHLKRKGKLLLVSRIQKDRKTLCELRSHLQTSKVNTVAEKYKSEPTGNFPIEETETLDDKELKKLEKDAVIEVLITIRKQIIEIESALEEFED